MENVHRAGLVLQLCEAALGGKLSDVDRGGIMMLDRSRVKDEKETVKALTEVALSGFMHLAAKGHEFPVSIGVGQLFGRSLEENYPEANEVFLKFARTYWTYTLRLDEWINRDTRTRLGDVLFNVESIIRGTFFPTPGPLKISAERREKEQRSLFRQTGAPIDVDEFMRGNPILIRDRATKKSSGCLAGFLVLSGLLVTSVIRMRH